MAALTWLLLLGVLTLVFSEWLESERNPNREVRSLVTAEGAREVALKRNRLGHYVVTGYINDRPVEFLLDTGATEVSIPASLAPRLGLRLGTPLLAQTANGTIMTYATRLERVALGDIVLRNIRANINPQMEGEFILLGMSFLKHLEFTQRGDTLTLKQDPP